MKIVLRKTTLAFAICLAASAANASSVPTGTVDVYGGMTPATVNTVEVPNIVDADPSFYELVVGGYDALTTFTLVDTNPDNKQVSYELYLDTEITENLINLGSKLTEWAYNDSTGGTFNYMLSANAQYVLKMFTNGASSSETQVSAVPLPGAALLFGSVLAGAGFMGRKKVFKGSETAA